MTNMNDSFDILQEIAKNLEFLINRHVILEKQLNLRIIKNLILEYKAITNENQITIRKNVTCES